MNRQPLFILFICFCLGIFLEDSFPLDYRFVFGFLGVAAFLSFSLFVKNWFSPKYQTTILCCFFFGLGIFTHYLNSIPPELPTFNTKEKIVFQLNKKLNSNEKNKRYEIEILSVGSGKSPPMNAILSIPKDEKELDFEHYYTGNVFLNQVNAPEFDYQFNYQKFLARQKIYYQAYLNSDLYSAEKTLNFYTFFKQNRLNVLKKIDQSSIKPRNREFLKGIILADRTEIDKQTSQDFSRSGLAHLLAISGAHMAIIFLLILSSIKPIFSAKHKNIPIIISIGLIWLFAVFINFGNSVTRSCIMISIYYLMIILQRKPDLLHSLSLAGFGILIFDSQQIFNVGFQLSFIAVLGIYWFNKPILNLLPKVKKPIIKFFFNIFSITISAQLATLPLIMHYFHQFSLVSIISNLVILPFAEVIIIFSLFMTFLIGLSININLLNTIYDYFIGWLLDAIRWFAEIDFAFFSLISINPLEVVILFVLFYFLRFLLISFSWKNILRFSYVLLLFFSVRIALNIHQYRQSEILVHHYFKEKIVSFKNKDCVVFYLKNDEKLDKIEKNIIFPYLVHRRVKRYQVKKLPENTKSIILNKKIIDLN